MRETFVAFERHTAAFSLSRFVAVALLVAAACIGLYQILSRFVLKQPAEWSEALVRFTLSGMVFMRAPMALLQGAKVYGDVAHHVAGPVGKRVLDVVAAVAAPVVIAVMLWFGSDYASRGRFQAMSGLESFSMTWAHLAIPVGAALSAIAMVACLIEPRCYELDTVQEDPRCP